MLSYSCSASVFTGLTCSALVPWPDLGEFPAALSLILDIENARLHSDRNEEKPGQSEVLESTAKWTRDLSLFSGITFVESF